MPIVQQLDDDQIKIAYYQIYTSCVKSCNLFYKLHKNNPNSIQTIIRIHENLAIYVREGQKQNKAIFEANWRKFTYKIFKFFSKKLVKESKIRFRSFDYDKINVFLQTIRVSLNYKLKNCWFV
jgi:hypothetical protein